MATAAQLLSQGPASVGSHGPLSQEELNNAKLELASLVEEHGFLEPERSHMEYPDIDWRFGKKPDYTLANLYYFKGKYKNHKAGTLELVVENLVKTWEMEVSHKKDISQWKTVQQCPSLAAFSANGWKSSNQFELVEQGSYNTLMTGVDKKLWDAETISWTESHDLFRKAMPAFSWEVLEVFCGPPKVAFSWHHYGMFTGEYKGNKGTGEWTHLFGFCVAEVNDKLELVNVEVFYDPATWLEVLEGKKPKEASETVAGCPFLNAKKKATGIFGRMFGCKDARIADTEK